VKRGKRKTPPPGYCTVCDRKWPAEEISTCCPTLCHRHCPHPLPPPDMPRWTTDTLIAHQLRSSWGVKHSHGKGKALDRARSEIGRRIH